MLSSPTSHPPSSSSDILSSPTRSLPPTHKKTPLPPTSTFRNRPDPKGFNFSFNLGSDNGTPIRRSTHTQSSNSASAGSNRRRSNGGGNSMSSAKWSDRFKQQALERAKADRAASREASSTRALVSDPFASQKEDVTLEQFWSSRLPFNDCSDLEEEYGSSSVTPETPKKRHVLVSSSPLAGPSTDTIITPPNNIRLTGRTNEERRQRRPRHQIPTKDVEEQEAIFLRKGLSEVRARQRRLEIEASEYGLSLDEMLEEMEKDGGGDGGYDSHRQTGFGGMDREMRTDEEDEAMDQEYPPSEFDEEENDRAAAEFELYLAQQQQEQYSYNEPPDFDYTLEDDNDDKVYNLSEPHSQDTFQPSPHRLAILSSIEKCPSCGISAKETMYSNPFSSSTTGPGGEGAIGCKRCGWMCDGQSFEGFLNVFCNHGIPPHHTPIFDHIPGGGTMVFCTGCEESFAL